jgi:hypothetical protein
VPVLIIEELIDGLDDLLSPEKEKAPRPKRMSARKRRQAGPHAPRKPLVLLPSATEDVAHTKEPRAKKPNQRPGWQKRKVHRHVILCYC